MFNRILVPVDGSPFAEAAFPTAIALAERVGGSIHLLRVRPHLWSDEVAELERALDQEAWGYLADTTEQLRGITSVPISGDLRQGNVVDEIVAAANVSHDLVVMTSHGRGGLSRFWLGSVTDACLRRTEKPIMVVRPEMAAFRMERVVVPLDGSILAESALPAAIALADAFGVPVMLMKSVATQIPLDSAFFPAPDWVPADPKALVDDARAYLEDVAKRSQTAQGTPLIHVVVGRHPALAIGEAAGITGTIVIAAHAHGELRRAFLGSVSDKTVRTAEGPVLVVHPQPARSDVAQSPSVASATETGRRGRKTVEA